MRQTILAVALLATVAMTGGLLAHEGHHHDALGTVATIDGAQMTLAVSEEEVLIFVLTDETSYLRGDKAVTRDHLAAGERAVVKYQKKDGANVVIEIRLAPNAEALKPE